MKSTPRFRVLCVLAGALLASCRKSEPDTVVVHAAASTTDALQEIGAAYQARTGRKVRFSFGGSSVLARQLEAGATADIFLSADVEKMDFLEKSGRLSPASRRDLLGNVLVVVVPLASSTAIAQPGDLARVGKIATGDPETVPIGIYARTWLQSAGVWESVKPQIVATPDVRAAIAAVEAETVAAAIVYRTDALQSSKVRIALEVPREGGPKIVYPIAVLASAREPGASTFLAELTSDAARAVFTRKGFLVPP